MYRKNALVLTKPKSIQRKHIKENKTIQNDEIPVEKSGSLCYNPSLPLGETEMEP